MPREPFTRVWTEIPTDDDYAEPTNIMWNNGWRGGADQDPPEAYAQNWWQKRADEALKQLEEKGALEWLSDVPYSELTEALGSDGQTYISRLSQEGNDPTLDNGTNWLLKSAGYLLANSGYYRLNGNLTLQWARVTGLANPGLSIGDTATYNVNYPIPFTQVFGALPSCFDDPATANPEGSEMSAAVVLPGLNSVSVKITRVTGFDDTGSETVGIFVLALGLTES